MRAPDEFEASTSSALIGGDLGRVVDEISQEFTLASATSGQVLVDPDALVQFYNDLSLLNDKIRTLMDSTHTTASSMHGAQAKCLLPGAKEAWTAMTEAAGSGMHSNSLYGNLRSVSQQVQGYMMKARANLEDYVANEGMAVVGITKAPLKAAELIKTGVESVQRE